MGSYLFDQYSLLHFAVGVVMYFWGISLYTWNMIHIFYEFIENTQIGINFIDQYITWWPGGKKHSDTIVNNVGDIISGAIGWYSAQWLDYYGKVHHW
jgi:hypothetical protein